MDKDKETLKTIKTNIPQNVLTEDLTTTDDSEEFLYLEPMRESTPRQRAAVRYCEEWLCIEFEDNINSFDDCSYFLSLYLEEAKEAERELSCELSTYLWELD